MTDVKPATDYMVGSIQKAHRHCSTTECGDVLVLLARVDADREENAANAHLIAQGIKVVNEQAAEIAALKGENAQLIEVYDHAQTGLKSMRAEAGKMREEIAHLKARYERDMCADGHERIRYTPEEEFGPCPVCVLRAENSTQGRLLALKEGELAALKAEVETVRGCLHELAATVRGEAPSLLNEDSGGDAFLSMRIDAALGTGMAR